MMFASSTVRERELRLIAQRSEGFCMRERSFNPIPAQRVAPGPRSYLSIGSLRRFGRDPLECLTGLARQYGDVVRLSLGPMQAYLVSSPDGIQHVLQDNSRNYGKGLSYQLMTPVIGKGLLTSDGPDWLRQHRLIQPAFHRRGVAAYVDLITDATTAMLGRWRMIAERGQSFDVVAEMIRLTRTIMSRLLFGSDVTDDSAPLIQSLLLAGTVGEQITRESTNNVLALLRAFGVLPMHASRRVQRTMDTVDQVLYTLIDERRRADQDRGDLLTHLIQARDETTGAQLSDREIRNALVTIFLAGNETTAVALAWLWYLVARYLEVAECLDAELASVLGGRVPTYDDLPNLAYTGMVVAETFRLYPPIWMLLRRAHAADTIGGWHIPAGAAIILSPYVTHHSATLWERPETFVPERFVSQHIVRRPRYAYFPFGGGAHICMGRHLALMEAPLIVAMVAQQYRLELVSTHPAAPQPMITLRPHQGIPMAMHQKHGS
jgi:cytochrome P450